MSVSMFWMLGFITLLLAFIAEKLMEACRELVAIRRELSKRS